MMEPAPSNDPVRNSPAGRAPQRDDTQIYTLPRSGETSALAPTGLAVVRVRGDLLKQRVEVIVNAWNRNMIPKWLLIPQGVSKAILKAAGQAPFDQLKNAGVLPLGGAVLTGAGNSSFKGIIHVAGINAFWRASEFSIRESTRNALRIAQEHGFTSIAFPAIGSGSTLHIGRRAVCLWGVSPAQSMNIIEDEAQRSLYKGRVVIVEFRPRR